MDDQGEVPFPGSPLEYHIPEGEGILEPPRRGVIEVAENKIALAAIVEETSEEASAKGHPVHHCKNLQAQAKEPGER